MSKQRIVIECALDCASGDRTLILEFQAADVEATLLQRTADKHGIRHGNWTGVIGTLDRDLCEEAIDDLQERLQRGSTAPFTLVIKANHCLFAYRKPDDGVINSHPKSGINKIEIGIESVRDLKFLLGTFRELLLRMDGKHPWR